MKIYSITITVLLVIISLFFYCCENNANSDSIKINCDDDDVNCGGVTLSINFSRPTNIMKYITIDNSEWYTNPHLHKYVFKLVYSKVGDNRVESFIEFGTNLFVAKQDQFFPKKSFLLEKGLWNLEIYLYSKIDNTDPNNSVIDDNLKYYGRIDGFEIIPPNLTTIEVEITEKNDESTYNLRMAPYFTSISFGNASQKGDELTFDYSFTYNELATFSYGVHDIDIKSNELSTQTRICDPDGTSNSKITLNGLIQMANTDSNVELNPSPYEACTNGVFFVYKKEYILDENGCVNVDNVSTELTSLVERMYLMCAYDKGKQELQQQIVSQIQYAITSYATDENNQSSAPVRTYFYFNGTKE